MRLADIITAVRAEVNDANASYWSDVQVAKWVNHWTRALFRQRCQADVSYSARRISIAKDDTTRVRQIQARVWAYHLPSWAYKVRQVRRSALVTEPAGPIIAPVQTQRPGSGWRFEGNRRLDLIGFENLDIDILVAKTPALIHSGAVRKDSVSAGELYIDHQITYPEDRELDAYLGAQFEMTGVASSTRDPRGVVGEAVAAVSVWDTTLGAWLVKVTVMPQFTTTPKVLDTYEMHPELDDAHCMYLILLAARSLLQEHNNKERLAQIEGVIAAQRVDFIDGIRQRQDLIPQNITEPFEPGAYFDTDRDLSWGYSW